MALFLAIGCALTFGLHSAINSGLRRITTAKFGSLNQIFGGTVNAEIIINGSSRAQTHYDPRVITSYTSLSAYNIGTNGTQIDLQLAMLRSYLKRNSRPRLVVQNLDSFSFETTRAGELYDPGAYLPYLDEPELYRGIVQIDPAAWKWKYLPLYGYAVEDLRFTWAWGVLGLVGVQSSESFYRGFTPRHLAWTGDFERFKTQVGSGVERRIEASGVAALRKMIETCKSVGTHMVLIYSPEYHEMQKLERNREKIFQTFTDLSVEFGVPFWDYSDSPLCQSRDNFYNSQHLNAIGAEKFSRLLAPRLAALLQNLDSSSASHRRQQAPH